MNKNRFTRYHVDGSATFSLYEMLEKNDTPYKSAKWVYKKPQNMVYELWASKKKDDELVKLLDIHIALWHHYQSIMSAEQVWRKVLSMSQEQHDIELITILLGGK